MKRAFVLGVLVFAVAVFAGCGKRQQGLQAENAPAATGEKITEKTVNSIYDAMSSGDKMKCTYTVQAENEEGGEGGIVTSEAYLEGDKYKSVTEIEGQGKMHTFFDGNDVYTWSENSKQGMKIGEDCYADVENDKTEEEESAEPDEASPEDVFNSAFNVQCEKVSSIDWSLPESVEFMDQCQLIKTQTQQLQNLQDQLPEGFEMPEGMQMPQ